jgi:uncharacterized membrane protein
MVTFVVKKATNHTVMGIYFWFILIINLIIAFYTFKDIRKVSND